MLTILPIYSTIKMKTLLKIFLEWQMKMLLAKDLGHSPIQSAQNLRACG